MLLKFPQLALVPVPVRISESGMLNFTFAVKNCEIVLFPKHIDLTWGGGGVCSMMLNNKILDDSDFRRKCNTHEQCRV